MRTRALAAITATVYVATLVIVPLLNPAMDAARLHPEDYTSATGGALVVVGYVAFAIALVLIAWLTACDARLWMRVATLCFAVAALVCAANAIDPTLGTRRSAIELGIFGLVIGPLVVSFASGGRALRVIAVIAAVAFAGIVFESDTVGGMVNRLFDALAAVWCIAFAASAPRGRRGIMRPSGEVA